MILTETDLATYATIVQAPPTLTNWTQMEIGLEMIVMPAQVLMTA
ncbi:unnamed protein product [marine sediment metagenome]|uniref:Uncharacterized protein n=1 Tax=marine sediment metagenome TaxID=412755 RepID=X1LAW1_9ZZZZ